MTVKLYVVTSSSSSRKAEKFLKDNDIKYDVQNMIHEHLSQEQLFEILACSENGVDDILSERSRDFKLLSEQGIDFDEMSLTELHEWIVEYPRLLRAPIIVAKGSTLVGYNDEEINMLISRSERKKAMQELLAIADTGEVTVYDEFVAV